MKNVIPMTRNTVTRIAVALVADLRYFLGITMSDITSTRLL